MKDSVPSQPTDPSQDPVLSDGAVLPVVWSEDLLLSLDWKRLIDVTRALAVYSGYEPEATAVERDGAAQFAMREGKQKRHGQQVIVRLAPWNRWLATAECVSDFAEEVRKETGTHAVYVAPGGSSPGAQAASRTSGVQILDARTLAARLNELPQEYSEFFHDRTTSGASTVPSCPVCLMAMTQSQEPAPTIPNPAALRDLSYKTHDIVGDPVVARRIEVLQNCEVLFLREVHAKDMVVNGIVKGDFLCDGSLLLNPGGVLTGTVSARSILVRPGGVLNGETRILQGPPEPIVRPVRPWVWRCEQVPRKPECEAVVFHPH